MVSPQVEIKLATEIDLSSSALAPSSRVYAEMANQMGLGELLGAFNALGAVAPTSDRVLFEQQTLELRQIITTGSALVAEMLELTSPAPGLLNRLQENTQLEIAQALGIEGTDLATFAALPPDTRAQYLHTALKAQLANPEVALAVMKVLAESTDPALDAASVLLLQQLVQVALEDMHLLRVLTMRALEAQAQRTAAANASATSILSPSGTTSANQASASLAALLSIYEEAKKLRDLMLVGKLVLAAAAVAIHEATLSYHREEVRKVRCEVQSLKEHVLKTRNQESSLRWRGSPEANAVEYHADKLDTELRDRDALLSTLERQLKAMEDDAPIVMAV